MDEKPDLIIYNSLSHKKELFAPAYKTVGIYVCGITPYDITHLGHAATYVFFDVVVRYLEYLGFKVKYVQNITDVDDDLLKKSRELKINYLTLADKNFQLFHSDLNWLNIRLPNYFPKATNHIKEIIDLNVILKKKGFAYEADSNLYFDISKYPKYGKLSGLSGKEMLPVSRERGSNPDDPNKKNPLDFVLWQKSKVGEPFWHSPWGKGRPGWHIECSAMSMKYIGKTIDIHGGGSDLIYPHHESEIAQSESVTGKPFARFFMHTSMLYYKGHKMSKSLGNMVFVKDLREKYSANVIRLLLLSNHYHKEWEFSFSLLEKIHKLNRLFQKVWITQSGQGSELDFSKEKLDIFNSLNDDFNTPLSLTVLKELSEKIIKAKNKNISSAKAFLNTCFNILGLSVEY